MAKKEIEQSNQNKEYNILIENVWDYSQKKQQTEYC